MKELLKKCPYLKEDGDVFAVVNMELLPESATVYSIESTPADPILKRYANGDTVRQYVFSLCSRELYGESENDQTAEFYEKFAEWLEECTYSGELPGLSGNMQSKSIRATTGGYLYDNQGTKCQYRIQCQFVYLKRR